MSLPHWTEALPEDRGQVSHRKVVKTPPSDWRLLQAKVRAPSSTSFKDYTPLHVIRSQGEQESHPTTQESLLRDKATSPPSGQKVPKSTVPLSCPNAVPRTDLSSV